MATSKWTPIPRFPLTATIHKALSKSVPNKLKRSRADIASEGLSDDIIQRVSPYLRRNAPVDILDLWPGSGCWSSKINEFLHPRRHVLIEPELEAYKKMLKPLAASKPGMELLSMDIYSCEDWSSVFREHLPEQKKPTGQEMNILPKNDTLLVLAQPPSSISTKNHYTPGRWWSVAMDTCMQQAGFHMYGSVRILALLPPDEVQGILPRSTSDRKRAAFLTENVALHAFELAKPHETEPWSTTKLWDMIKANTDRVAERTAAQNIFIPPGREPVPYDKAPLSPPTRNPHPYNPRVRTERHEKLLEDIAYGGSFDKKDKSAKAVAARRKRMVANSTLIRENRFSWTREDVSKKKQNIDEKMLYLARAAADSRSSQSTLERMDQEIATLQDDLAKELAGQHYRLFQSYDRSLDDARVATLSNNYDNSVLLWDRRPFEPLRIHEGELFPRVPRTLVYFEADANPPAMQKLRGVPFEKRMELLRLFDSLSFVFGAREKMATSELLESIFPGRSTDDIVKAVPALVPHAAKRLKPGCGPLPLPDDTLDANECYQANLHYDLSDARLHCLPTTTMWDILTEYQRHALDLSTLQFARLLGGTMTSYRSGGHSPQELNLH